MSPKLFLAYLSSSRKCAAFLTTENRL